MSHRLFLPIISFCILGNTFILALNKYPPDIIKEFYIGYANQIFYLVFLFEMVVRLIGEGPKSYFSSSFNSFDFFVIVVSTADLVLDNLNLSSGGIMGAIRVLRVFRLLRVFKLAKVWKDLNDLISTTGVVLVKISYFSIVLIFFLLTFSILGKEFFAYKMAFDYDDTPVEDFYDFETGT